MRALGLRPATVDVNNQNCKTMKMYEYILNEKNTHFNTIIYKQKPFKIAVTVKVNLSNILFWITEPLPDCWDYVNFFKSLVG